MQTDVCALLCLPVRQSAPATCCFPGADLERAWAEGFKLSEKEITHSEASLAPEISSEKEKKPQRCVQNHSAVALVLVRSSRRQHRTGAVWPPALAVYYTADASLSFPSFQTCQSFSVAAYGEFVSGALWVEYMAVKHKFKFSLKNCCVFLSGIKNLLVSPPQAGFECAAAKSRRLFKPEEFLNVT